VDLKLEFWSLVLTSVVMPVGIYAYMIRKRRISRVRVVGFGLLLILLSAIDALLLKHMITIARGTSPFHDLVFASEFSIALYLLPLVSAAIGTNLVSHVLVRHLFEAERRYDECVRGDLHDARPDGCGPASGWKAETDESAYFCAAAAPTLSSSMSNSSTWLASGPRSA
jgi:hypothetical protein